MGEMLDERDLLCIEKMIYLHPTVACMLIGRGGSLPLEPAYGLRDDGGTRRTKDCYTKKDKLNRRKSELSHAKPLNSNHQTNEHAMPGVSLETRRTRQSRSA